MHTPEFLAWAIEQCCPLRGELDGSDPERTERQLRTARAVSEARCEGRVLEGFAIQPPNGFRIADAMAIYGGEAAVGGACGNCPANALTGIFDPCQAGCYGTVPLPEDPTPFHEAIDRSMIRWAESFPATSPRWYGLWLDSPLEIEWLFLTWQVLDIPEIQSRQLQDLMLALNTAFNIGGRLHVRLYPPGRVEGTWWRLVPHCPRCKAAWRPGDSRYATEGVPYSAVCEVCGYVGHPAPEQKRRARGKRPYFPLERLLGKEPAAEFLIRYEAERARRGSPDRA